MVYVEVEVVVGVVVEVEVGVVVGVIDLCRIERRLTWGDWPNEPTLECRPSRDG